MGLWQRKKRLTTKFQAKEDTREKVSEISMAAALRKYLTCSNPVSLELKGFLDSSQFSDFTIRNENKEFRVHKIVLCAQSGYFSKMLRSDQWKESQNNEIELLEDDPRAIEAMVHFMYDPSTKLVDDDSDGKTAPTSILAFIWATAEKYQIPDLKERVQQDFGFYLRSRWKTVVNTFPEIVEAVYDTSSHDVRGLRDKVITAARVNKKELLQRDDFQDLIARNGEFATDMVVSLAQTTVGMKTYECSPCGIKWQSHSHRDEGFCMACGKERRWRK